MAWRAIANVLRRASRHNQALNICVWRALIANSAKYRAKNGWQSKAQHRVISAALINIAYGGDIAWRIETWRIARSMA